MYKCASCDGYKPDDDKSKAIWDRFDNKDYEPIMICKSCKRIMKKFKFKDVIEMRDEIMTRAYRDIPEKYKKF
jgi:hypothetical protein